jgi:copper transport protein
MISGSRRRTAGGFAGRRTEWRFGAALILTMAGLLSLANPNQAAAHAYLESSNPSANSVVDVPPTTAMLWFTEPVEKEFSRVTLYDASGNPVPEAAMLEGGDPNQIMFFIPVTLPRGTYTIQWVNTSATDGHSQSGYIPFTVGTQADVTIPVAPPDAGDDGPPTWLNALGRWLNLLGVAGALGGLATWLWVVQPASQAVPVERRDQLASRARELTVGAVVVALTGSLISLLVQIDSSGTGVGVQTAYDLLTGTRYGALWLVRVGLLTALGVWLALAPLWRTTPRLPVSLFSLLLAAAVLVPLALNTHSAALGVGRQAALVADAVHMAAASVWVGGLLMLAFGLVEGSSGLATEQRRRLYGLAIPRFSTLAISSVILLTLTGFYLAWVLAGNLTALRETSYGRALLVKAGLMAVMVGLGGFNQLVLGPRLRRAAASGVNFGRSIGLEALLGIAVLLAAGVLTSLPAARDSLVSESGQATFRLEASGQQATLRLSPGAVGMNRYTLDFPDETELPAGSEVFLRTANSGTLDSLRETRLAETGERRFEAIGSELSVEGEWNLEVVLRRPGQTDWRAETLFQVATTPPAADSPGPAPRFPGLGGAVWICAGAIAVVLGVFAIRERRGKVWLAASLLLLAFCVGGLGLSWQMPEVTNDQELHTHVH